ncbi:MAG: family 16 glycosylhydrolase [Chitinispirillales bacterium]|jgi:beta-glucanase (GH16 family)|nr:family 16 glycosylhydrolase [Chitinispirillales bacterium]
MLNKIIKTVVLTAAVVATTAQAIPITLMSTTQGPNIIADENGGSGFTFPTFNGGTAAFDDVKEDLKVFVWYNSTEQWIDLDGNAESGWIYNQNWGHFWEGGGGFWFHVERTTYIKLQSAASSGVYLDYTIIYDVPERVGNNLSAKNGQTTMNAGGEGNIGVQFPFIGGTPARSADIEKFVYEIRINDDWVELYNSAASGFYYSSNGYNPMSDKNQWAVYYEGGGGLWFKPVQEDYRFRIGYPADGIKGGAIDNNYVEYSFTGNPDAYRPDVSNLGNIALGTSTNSDIAGWRLIWNDEFNENSLNRDKWDYDIGYYINDDPNTWGWGNDELEYYTDSEKNIFVEDGRLNLKALHEPKAFPQNPSRQAPYSSGKVVTKGKFAFKYGRIDFCAKLPAGNGLWPALWMLPQDDAYGGWAASGEIDVMEARGRLPGESSGAVHFGGGWPEDKYIGNDYYFENGQRIDTDFHVYSVVWEEDNIKWYVDGKCFYKATNEQWYSLGAHDNKNAPFDQDFFIIMNLAVGGKFDGGQTPNAGDIPATMQVDYVRVYKADGNGSTPINNAATKKVGKDYAFAGIKNGQINLRLKEGAYTVELYNLQGRIIDKVNISATNGVNATGLKTNNLSKGMFILNVKQADASILRRKIMIE